MLSEPRSHAFLKLFTVNGLYIENVRQIENSLERGFVEHWLNAV